VLSLYWFNELAMKQKRLPKSLLPFIALFSLLAFLFVNLHGDLPLQNASNIQTLTQSKLENESDEKDYDVKIPDVGFLGKVLDIAQKLLPVAH
jgi:cell division protein FtsL